MAIEDLFDWYQKKIGSYDKQLWEKTLEEKIISGLKHIQMKSAKPKPDLIDVDLVRGSSFTKAKPKHGFITVARHATLRLIFLPLYAKWWVNQTSGRTFAVFLLLYLSEFVNIGVYFYNTAKIPAESVNVNSAEIIIPIVMMWVLSVIHSEIVATNPGGPERKLSQVETQRRLGLRRSNTAGSRMLMIRSKKRSKEKKSCEAAENTDGRPRLKVKLKSKKAEAAEIKQGEPSRSRRASDSSLDSDSHSDAGRPLAERDDDGFESLNSNGSNSCDNFKDVPTVPPSARKDLDENSLKCGAWIRSSRSNRTAPLCRQQSAPNLFRESSGTESDTSNTRIPHRLQSMRRNSQIPITMTAHADSTCDTEDEVPWAPAPDFVYPSRIAVAADWCGVTTNSEDCSYTSEYNNESDDSEDEPSCDYLNYKTDESEFRSDWAPTAILSPCCSASDKVSCTIWENTEVKKAELSVFDISSAIISKVESMPQSMDYFYVGVIVSTVLAALPVVFRFWNSSKSSAALVNNVTVNFAIVDTSEVMLNQVFEVLNFFVEGAFGAALWERTVIFTASIQRWVLACSFFFLLAVAERTFKQRYLYAKLFAHLTSSRRARNSELPHFRLNKVRNIKTWLSVRSYLRKRGLQRSVDVIVSAAFIITLLLLSFLSFELLKDTIDLHSQYILEAMIWCFGLGVLLLRFMTLGTEINKKYRNLSVLITEQINLYLQIEQKPDKKNELMVANSVLKLAADLLKELESPFKISGLSANPYLYNITKVVILSALSGVLSDMLGFKLKLHKIKVQ